MKIVILTNLPMHPSTSLNSINPNNPRDTPTIIKNRKITIKANYSQPHPYTSITRNHGLNLSLNPSPSLNLYLCPNSILTDQPKINNTTNPLIKSYSHRQRRPNNDPNPNLNLNRDLSMRNR